MCDSLGGLDELLSHTEEMLDLYARVVYGVGVGQWVAPHLRGNFEVGAELLTGHALQEARMEALDESFTELYDARRCGEWLPEFLAPQGSYNHDTDSDDMTVDPEMPDLEWSTDVDSDTTV